MFLCLPGMEAFMMLYMNCIKNIQNVSNEHASNIASIKELCKVRDKVVYSELSPLEANTLIQLICTNSLTTVRGYSSIVYSLYDMSLYIFEGRNLYFNCVFRWSRIKTGYLHFSNCSGEPKNFRISLFVNLFFSFHNIM